MAPRASKWLPTLWQRRGRVPGSTRCHWALHGLPHGLRAAATAGRGAPRNPRQFVSTMTTTQLLLGHEGCAAKSATAAAGGIPSRGGHPAKPSLDASVPGPGSVCGRRNHQGALTGNDHFVVQASIEIEPRFADVWLAMKRGERRNKNGAPAASSPPVAPTGLPPGWTRRSRSASVRPRDERQESKTNFRPQTIT